MARGRAMISAFPEEMLKKLTNPEIMNFLARLKMLNTMQSLLTLVAVADDVEEKLIATTRSRRSDVHVVEWLCHFQDIMFRLEEVMNGKEANDEHAEEAALISLLHRFEIITNQKHHLLRYHAKNQGDPFPFIYIRTREAEMNGLIAFLLSDHLKTHMIGITGSPGIGKTTFAKVAYHDNRVKACFDGQGWVKCRPELDAESLGKIILDRFNVHFHYDDDINLQELMLQIRNCLSGKNFCWCWMIARFRILKFLTVEIAIPCHHLDSSHLLKFFLSKGSTM